MSFVVLDIGASGARYTSSGVICTLPNSATFLTKIGENHVEEMDPKPVEVRRTDNDIMNNLEVIVERKEGPNEFFPMHAIMGELADSYGAGMTYPNSMSSKGKQRINYLSTVVSVALSKWQNNMGEDITLYVALPPAEVKNDKEHYINGILGSYDVTFPRINDGVTISFKISSVHCYEEGVMAIRSFFQTVQGGTRPDAMAYFPKTVMSIDIGASTTDVAVIKGGRFMKKTGKTIRRGGNSVRDKMTDRVNSLIDSEISMENANLAMAEGRIQYGDGYMDVSGILDDAKKEVAHSLVEELYRFFNSTGISLTSINAIVVSGGGSVCSKYINENNEEIVTTGPMSDYISSAITQYCPGIKVLSHPMDNPRFANIAGLFITAASDSLRSST